MVAVAKKIAKNKAVAYCLSILAILLLWKAAARAMNAPLILPAPELVLDELFELCRSRVFWQNVFATLRRVFTSFAISIALGAPLGFFCGTSRFFNNFFAIPLTLVRATPVVSVILVALFLFNSSTVPIFVSVLMTLPLAISSVAAGFAQKDEKLLAMAKVYRLSRRQIFRWITLPRVLPFFLSGAVSSFGLSWKVVAAGEVLSVPAFGAGSLMQRAQVHLETAELIATTLVIVALSFALEKIFAFAVSKSTDLASGDKSKGFNASMDDIFDSDNICDNKFKHLNSSTDLKNSDSANFARDNSSKGLNSSTDSNDNNLTKFISVDKFKRLNCSTDLKNKNLTNSISACKFKRSNISTDLMRGGQASGGQAHGNQASASATNAPILSVEHLSISRGGKTLYRDFSLDITAGSVTCLIAPSGAGKTTLLDYIAGTLENADASGRVLFSGTEVRPALSFLFQESRLIPTASVLENVMLPLVNLMPKSEAEERARNFIALAGLSEKCESLPEALSGGERQRVSMARSFAFPSKLLLLDEPFQSQDLKIKLRLMDTLASLLATERRTALFVTHDAKEAVSLADRIIVMDGSPLEIVFDKNHVAHGDETFESTIASLVVHSRF